MRQFYFFNWLGYKDYSIPRTLSQRRIIAIAEKNKKFKFKSNYSLAVTPKKAWMKTN
jgi:hypothetical protein